jgi:hypothetical protein
MVSFVVAQRKLLEMKKIAFIFSLVLGFTVIMTAQVEFDEIRFGFELSPVISSMNTDDNRIGRNGSNLGLKLSTTGEYRFRENFAITGGLALAFNHGGTLRHDSGGDLLNESDLEFQVDTLMVGYLPDMVDIHYKLQYIEVPIGLKLYAKTEGDWQYYVHFPQLIFGFNVQALADVEGGKGKSSINEERLNVQKDVSFINLSYGVGGGAIKELSSTTAITIGIAYQRTFTDVTGDNGVKVNGDKEDSKAYFGALILKLGILF